MPARVTVQVPDHLKQRMSELGDRVNWSAVAREAFERRLAELSTETRNLALELAAQRLLAETTDSRAAAAFGKKLGKRWAMEHAARQELARVDAWLSAHKGNTTLAITQLDARYAPYQRFYFLIRPDERGERVRAEEFWESIIATEPERAQSLLSHENELAFVSAFAEAVQDVWRTIEMLIAAPTPELAPDSPRMIAAG